ncbi:MAG: hypothetical protein HN348_22965 [Proteobacteria bacterium]|nr:hypothetical protein [Pseudomonadota bacterium]
MLTTESANETLVDVFDGFLTWDWTHEDMVPVFPAVYGGKIALFGRKYHEYDEQYDQPGEDLDEIAFRQKTAQALVFGEQLGWMSADLTDHTMAATSEFIRKAAQLRYDMSDYINGGDMAVPPAIEGTIPDITGDWFWGYHVNETMVTTSAVFSSAWMDDTGALVLFFANASDEAVTFDLNFQGGEYGFAVTQLLSIQSRDENGVFHTETLGSRFVKTIDLDGESVLAIQIVGL